MDQDPDFDESLTVKEVIYDGEDAKLAALQAYNEAVESADADRIQTTMQKVDDLKAWDREARAEEILYKLQLTDLDQHVGELSGGQKKRLALTKMILADPDFLILDEPTNHLDVEMIEWLENYLSASSLTLFMVTHDRYFLERICNEIIELDKGQLFVYRGNYSDYLEKKALIKPLPNYREKDGSIKIISDVYCPKFKIVPIDEEDRKYLI